MEVARKVRAAAAALALAVTAALTLATATPLRAADSAPAAAVVEAAPAPAPAPAAKVAPAGRDASVPATAAVASPAASEKILRVATSGDYAPFSFSSSPESPAADGSDLRGFDVELARQFARDHGYRLEFVRFRWPELSKQMAAGTFDVAVGGITMRTERSIGGRYSVPLVATHAVALTWKGSGVTERMELDRAGRRVYVNAGGHLEHVADETFRRAQVIPLADNDAVRMALLDRMGDAVVTDDFEQKVWTANVRGVVAIGPLSDDRKAWFLPPAKAELAAEIDRWLLAKERDGTLARLRTQEFGASDSDYAPTATPVAAFATAVAERQALMPMVWAAKRRLGKPVEDKAQEAAVLDAAMNALNAAATAAGQPAPDAEAARAVFEQLLVISKDTQQALADRDSRRRPGTVIVRSKNGQAASSAAGDGAPKPDGDPAGAGDAAKSDDAAAPAAGTPAVDVAGPSASPAKGEAAAPVSPPRDPSAPRAYDLATELRPAIARITEKIARAMLAMEPAMSSRQATNALDEALTPGGTKGERIEVLVDALVVWSSRRPYGKP